MFYYCHLNLFKEILVNKGIPFIRSYTPNYIIIKNNNGEDLLISLKHFFNCLPFVNFSSPLKFQIRNDFRNASEIKNCFVRMFFENPKDMTNWEDLNGIGFAIEFTDRFHDIQSDTLKCFPIDYKKLRSKFSSLKSFEIINFVKEIRELPDDYINREETITIQYTKAVKEFRIVEIDDRSLEIARPNISLKYGYIHEFGFERFIIGPDTNINKNALRKILAFYNMFFDWGLINDKIKKLVYKLRGVDYL